MQLRLLLTPECNRSCKLCCNKNYDLQKVPVCDSFKGYEAIMITGGEPLLDMDLFRECVWRIREQDYHVPIFVYTAWTRTEDLLEALRLTDGITLTLHTRKDVEPFQRLQEVIYQRYLEVHKSLRLNVFKGIAPGSILTKYWKVKEMEWEKDCPVPTNEVFMRYRRDPL